jgi:hypothetical protein
MFVRNAVYTSPSFPAHSLPTAVSGPWRSGMVAHPSLRSASARFPTSTVMSLASAARASSCAM